MSTEQPLVPLVEAKRYGKVAQLTQQSTDESTKQLYLQSLLLSKQHKKFFEATDVRDSNNQLELAYALFATEEYSKSMDVIEKYVGKNMGEVLKSESNPTVPASIDWLNLYAQNAYCLDRREEAILAYEKLIEISPDARYEINLAASYCLLSSYYSLKDLHINMENYENYEYLKNYAVAFNLAGDVARSHFLIEKAMRLAPSKNEETLLTFLKDPSIQLDKSTKLGAKLSQVQTHNTAMLDKAEFVKKMGTTKLDHQQHHQVVQLNLAICYFLLHKTEKATSLIEPLLKLDDVVGMRANFLAYELKLVDKSKVVKRFSTSPEVQLYFSENSLDVLKSLDMLSDYPATLATLNDVPDDITYDNLALKEKLADYKLSNDEFCVAAKLYNEILDLDPENIQVLAKLVKVTSFIDPSEAETLLDRFRTNAAIDVAMDGQVGDVGIDVLLEAHTKSTSKSRTSVDNRERRRKKNLKQRAKKREAYLAANPDAVLDKERWIPKSMRGKRGKRKNYNQGSSHQGVKVDESLDRAASAKNKSAPSSRSTKNMNVSTSHGRGRNKGGKR